MTKISVSVGIIVLDQISKLLVLKYWPQIVSSNNGGAFSLLQNYRYYNLLVAVLIVLLIVSMIYLKNVRTWPVFLIVAGATSNLIDRLARSSVVDFIDLEFFSSFNIADIAITCGLIWLIWVNIFSSKKA